jgi:hypothetical protein
VCKFAQISPDIRMTPPVEAKTWLLNEQKRQQQQQQQDRKK